MAISIYSLFFSMPIHCLPSFLATTAVVPLPMKGSNTISPSSDEAVIIISKSFSGFCVGCAALPSAFFILSLP